MLANIAVVFYFLVSSCLSI